jgi:mono/diheme cytochrome c family protein
VGIYRYGAPCVVLLVCGIVFSAPLKAQQYEYWKQSSSDTLTEQQKAGELLFQLNCPFCHEPVRRNRKDPNSKLTARVKLLDHLFSGANPRTEDYVRQTILHGVPQRMPSFQYILEPKELDDLIAFLKVLDKRND